MKSLIRLLCLAFLLATAGNVQAGVFTGQTVGYNFSFDTQSNVIYDPGPLLVGAGVELNNGLYVVGGVGTLDISDSKIKVDYTNFLGTGGEWTSVDFSGFRIFDFNNTLSDITSVTIKPTTNMVGFDDSRITFDANNIFVNFQGLKFEQNTVVLLDVNGVSAVPEPASIAIWGFGALGCCLVARRKKK